MGELKNYNTFITKNFITIFNVKYLHVIVVLLCYISIWNCKYVWHKRSIVIVLRNNGISASFAPGNEDSLQPTDAFLHSVHSLVLRESKKFYVRIGKMIT